MTKTDGEHTIAVNGLELSVADAKRLAAYLEQDEFALFSAALQSAYAGAHDMIDGGNVTRDSFDNLLAASAQAELVCDIRRMAAAIRSQIGELAKNTLDK